MVRYRKDQKEFIMSIQKQTIHYNQTRFMVTLPKPLAIQKKVSGKFTIENNQITYTIVD